LCRLRNHHNSLNRMRAIHSDTLTQYSELTSIYRQQMITSVGWEPSTFHYAIIVNADQWANSQSTQAQWAIAIDL
jgi:hypothetical protein